MLFCQVRSNYQLKHKFMAYVKMFHKQKQRAFTISLYTILDIIRPIIDPAERRKKLLVTFMRVGKSFRSVFGTPYTIDVIIIIKVHIFNAVTRGSSTRGNTTSRKHDKTVGPTTHCRSRKLLKYSRPRAAMQINVLESV